MCTQPVLNRICKESYNDPQEVYSRLKAHGMDLVTLTDHDSIGGAEELRRNADFFLSEEVTCRMPSGTEAHVGVYDISERDHVEIQRRRNDVPRLLAYLTERRLIFSVNHMFSSLTGRRTLDDFRWFMTYFPCAEIRNGQIRALNNRKAEELARQHGRLGLGGSDSHTLLSLGSAYTEVPGARNKAEFMDGIRAGKAVVGGTDGGYFRLTTDVLYITAQMFREDPWKALLSPLALLVPLGTGVTFLNEVAFVRDWSTRVGQAPRDLRADVFGDQGQTPAEVFAWP